MDNQPSNQSSNTIESFSYTYKSKDGLVSCGSTDVPLTPIFDPVARLTRECSALRLRLATAERAARPVSTYSQSSNQLEGIRAPPSSARTPPSVGSRLGFPAEGGPPPGFITTSTFTYTHSQINPPSQQPSQPKTVPRPSQLNQQSPTRHYPDN